MNKEELRKVIREMVESSMIDEERISNVDAAQKVKNRENFIGSHTYGEDLGDLGKVYVAYSYGEQHPLYVWSNGSWYYNTDDYILDDGQPNIWTKKHLKNLNPGGELKPRSGEWLQKFIDKFKDTNNLGDNSHSDLEPGEK